MDQTDIPFVSVGYRRAPDATGTTLTEDVFAGLTWLVSHARELGADPGRIAVMGDSGGGGLAAGAAILARDRESSWPGRSSSARCSTTAPRPPT